MPVKRVNQTRPLRPERSTPRGLPQTAMRKLRELDQQLNDVNAAYLDRLHREVEVLMATVKTRGGRDRLKRNESRDLDKISTWLDELEVKPEKGRRKDLHKIDKLIGKIQSVLDGWA